jgi:hypothetical protein
MSGAKFKSAGATRGQLILVGVLAVILVGVVANNLRGSAEAPSPTEPADASSTVGPAPPALVTTKLVADGSPFGEFAVDADWPAPTLQQLINFDPLAPPASIAASEPGSDSSNDGLSNLQQAQDAIIFVSGDQRIARIGETEYHVGDAVGRFRITEISSAGIVLSEPQGDSRDR